MPVLQSGKIAHRGDIARADAVACAPLTRMPVRAIAVAAGRVAMAHVQRRMRMREAIEVFIVRFSGGAWRRLEGKRVAGEWREVPSGGREVRLE